MISSLVSLTKAVCVGRKSENRYFIGYLNEIERSKKL